MEQISLFPSLVFKTHLDNYEKFIPAVLSRTIKDGRLLNFTSPDLFKDLEFAEICDFARLAGNTALDQWGYEQQPLEFRSLWGVEYFKDGMIKQHGHINTWFSGVVYLRSEPNDGIIFHDPRPRSLGLQAKVKKWTPFNQPIQKMDSSPGTCYIFPGWLEHSTDFSTIENNTRVIMAWNFNIPPLLSGGFGDYG